MEDLLCKKCKKFFNAESKVPLRLPSCGHSYCLDCARTFLGEGEDSNLITCPDDNQSGRKDSLSQRVELDEKGDPILEINQVVMRMLKMLMVTMNQDPKKEEPEPAKEEEEEAKKEKGWEVISESRSNHKEEEGNSNASQKEKVLVESEGHFSVPEQDQNQKKSHFEDVAKDAEGVKLDVESKEKELGPVTGNEIPGDRRGDIEMMRIRETMKTEATLETVETMAGKMAGVDVSMEVDEEEFEEHLRRASGMKKRDEVGNIGQDRIDGHGKLIDDAAPVNMNENGFVPVRRGSGVFHAQIGSQNVLGQGFHGNARGFDRVNSLGQQGIQGQGQNQVQLGMRMGSHSNIPNNNNLDPTNLTQLGSLANHHVNINQISSNHPQTITQSLQHGHPHSNNHIHSHNHMHGSPNHQQTTASPNLIHPNVTQSLATPGQSQNQTNPLIKMNNISQPYMNMLNQPYETQNRHICLEHQAIADLICHTDQKIICSNCALFGVHKGHNYVKFEDFRNDCRGKIQALKSEFEKMKFRRFLREGDKEAQFMREKIKDKKQLLFSEIDTASAEMIKKIKERGSRVKELIEKNFERFGEVVDEWSTVQMKIKDKAGNLEHRLLKLSKAVMSQNTDFQFLLENLYNDANFGDSPKKEIEDLTKEVMKHEGTAAGYIESEIAKFEIKSEPETLKRILQSRTLLLYYEESPLQKSLINHSLEQISNSKYTKKDEKTEEKGDSKEREDQAAKKSDDLGDLSVGSRGSRVSIDGLGSSSGSASDSEVESVGEVEESEDRQRAPLGVGVNQNFDLRKSVNFDIQKELISKAVLNQSAKKATDLSAVKEKEFEENTPISNQKRGNLLLEAPNPNQFRDKRRSTVALTEELLANLHANHFKNLANEKSAKKKSSKRKKKLTVVSAKIEEEEVDRVNNSELADTSGRNMGIHPRNAGMGSFPIYQAEVSSGSNNRNLLDNVNENASDEDLNLNRQFNDGEEGFLKGDLQFDSGAVSGGVDSGRDMMGAEEDNLFLEQNDFEDDPAILEQADQKTEEYFPVSQSFGGRRLNMGMEGVHRQFHQHNSFANPQSYNNNSMGGPSNLQNFASQANSLVHNYDEKMFYIDHGQAPLRTSGGARQNHSGFNQYSNQQHNHGFGMNAPTNTQFNSRNNNNILNHGGGLPSDNMRDHTPTRSRGLGAPRNSMINLVKKKGKKRSTGGNQLNIYDRSFTKETTKGKTLRRGPHQRSDAKMNRISKNKNDLGSTGRNFISSRDDDLNQNIKRRRTKNKPHQTTSLVDGNLYSYQRKKSSNNPRNQPNSRLKKHKKKNSDTSLGLIGLDHNPPSHPMTSRRRGKTQKSNLRVGYSANALDEQGMMGLDNRNHSGFNQSSKYQSHHMGNNSASSKQLFHGNAFTPHQFDSMTQSHNMTANMGGFQGDRVGKTSGANAKRFPRKKQNSKLFASTRKNSNNLLATKRDRNLQRSSRRVNKNKQNSYGNETPGEHETELNLSKKNITDMKLKDYLPLIDNNPKLKVLHLSYNRLKHLGFSILVDHVADHPSLETIYLNDNHLDEQIFQVLRQNVKRLRRLKYINLYNNRGIKNVDRYKQVISHLRKNKIRLDFK